MKPVSRVVEMLEVDNEADNGADDVVDSDVEPNSTPNSFLQPYMSTYASTSTSTSTYTSTPITPTPALTSTFTSCLLDGNPITVACHLTAITLDTYKKWISQGTDADHYPAQHYFRTKVLQARAQVTTLLSRRLMDIAINGRISRTYKNRLVKANGVPVRDENGHLKYELILDTERHQDDPDTIMAILEKVSPHEWAGKVLPEHELELVKSLTLSDTNKLKNRKVDLAKLPSDLQELVRSDYDNLGEPSQATQLKLIAYVLEKEDASSNASNNVNYSNDDNVNDSDR